MDRNLGFNPQVTASEVMMWMANQAARSQPYSGTMNTGSQVNETALSPISTIPTSTPCWGPTRTFSLLAPSRGNISSLKILGEILPISGISFTSAISLFGLVEEFWSSIFPLLFAVFQQWRHGSESSHNSG
ncbi:hypothetical protein ES703_10590 [subsurface metagenome]